ncbi:MAG: MaoC family dehydratase, partial [Microbacterium sp.]|nr:MaoC family dehydratase [Microbacterium sp.]
MPVNPDLLGRSYPPTAPVVVTAERVRAFAAAVGATDPDAAAAPPTFAIVVQQAALDALDEQRKLLDQGLAVALYP